MTSKFTKPVYRETQYAIRDGSIEREIIVGLEQGDVISVRLKRSRQKVGITAQQLYNYAMKLEGERLLREKRSK